MGPEDEIDDDELPGSGEDEDDEEDEIGDEPLDYRDINWT